MATKLKTRPSKEVAGATEVLILVDHPMETGQREDRKTKKKIPAHYIQRLTLEVNGKAMAEFDLGPAVSKDPLVAIASKSIKKGDKIKASWTDNNGKKEAGDLVA